MEIKPDKEEASLGYIDLQSCVSANNGLPCPTNSLLYITSVGSRNNLQNRTLAGLQWGKNWEGNYFPNRSNISYNDVYDKDHIVTSGINAEYEVKDNCIAQNYNVTNHSGRIENVGKYDSTEGLTFGHTNSNIYCTTVHFAHECQVSTGGSTDLSDSDHATLATNMTSGSGLFRTKNWAKLYRNHDLQELMGQYEGNSFMWTNDGYTSNYSDLQVPNGELNTEQGVHKSSTQNSSYNACYKQQVDGRQTIPRAALKSSISSNCCTCIVTLALNLTTSLVKV